MTRRPGPINARLLSAEISWWPAAITLLLVIPVLAHGIGRGDFYYNVDETLHAVGGLFFADLLRDRPVTDPMHYTLRWYAHYPALGIGIWPPLFYLVEGIFFLLLGPWPVTARLTILVFAVFGLYFWFRLVASLLNRWAAAFATLLLAFLPFVLLFEQSVMLEIPALSLCLAATYYWISYIESEKGKELRWFAFFSALALLAKQLSIYLALFCLLTLITEKKLRLLRTRGMLIALGVIFLLAGPYYLGALRLTLPVFKVDVLGPPGNYNPYLFYLHALPTQLGLPVLVLSVIGAVTWRWWASARCFRYMAAWIAACYLVFTFLFRANMDVRFTVYWIPAFLFLAVGPLTRSAASRYARVVTALVLAALIAHQTWVGWHFQREYVSGYEAAARRIMKNGSPGFVLFDGQLPGNFIFYMRAFDRERKSVILRKALYVTLIQKQIGGTELVHGRAEIEQLLSAYGVRYILVDNGPMDFGVQEVLRGFLQDSPYRLVGTFPIESNVPDWNGRKLFLYENPAPPAVTAESLRLKMLTMGRDFDIPINDLDIK